MWTIIRFIIRFFQDLWHAAIFAAAEYDEKLQLTKTPAQRFVIWLMVAGMVILGLIILVMFVRQALDAVIVPGI